jgi:hypothetical protein
MATTKGAQRSLRPPGLNMISGERLLLNPLLLLLRCCISCHGDFALATCKKCTKFEISAWWCKCTADFARQVAVPGMVESRLRFRRKPSIHTLESTSAGICRPAIRHQKRSSRSRLQINNLFDLKLSASLPPVACVGRGTSKIQG